MSNSTLIGDYLQQGSGAPSSAPPVASGVTAFYLNTANNNLYAYNWATPGWELAGGGGGGGTAPTVRGSSLVCSSSNSFTVTWPTGTVAGDMAVLFVTTAYLLSSIPTGWTVIDEPTGSGNWVGYVLLKVLNSTDISTGSVTVSLTGSFDTVVSIVTFDGNTDGLVGFTTKLNVSTVTSFPMNVGAVIPGAMCLYFNSARVTSPTITSSQGSLLHTANDTNGGGSLYAGVPSVPAPATSLISCSAGFAGQSYSAVVQVLGP